MFTCVLSPPNFQSFLLVDISAAFLPCLVRGKNHYWQQRWTSTEISTDIWCVNLSPYPRNVSVCILQTFKKSQWGFEDYKPRWTSTFYATAGLCFWPGLWNHEWSIFLCKHPVWLLGARHSGHSWRLSPVLPIFSFHDAGDHIATHVLGHCIFWWLWEEKVVPPFCSSSDPPAGVSPDLH